jgi:hypothetical protein
MKAIIFAAAVQCLGANGLPTICAYDWKWEVEAIDLHGGPYVFDDELSCWAKADGLIQSGVTNTATCIKVLVK